MNYNNITNKILDQTKDLIWVVDSNLTLIYANKAYLSLMKEVTGIDKALNTPILVEGFGEGYIEKWKAYYNRALSGEYFEIEEHYYNPETNDIQYGQITFTPVVEDIDKTHSVACRSTDITRIVKHKLEVNQDLKHLYDTIPDILCITDFSGRILKINKAGCELLGCAQEEIIAHSFDEFVHPDDVDIFVNEIKNLSKETKTFEFENRNITKESKVIWLSWSCNIATHDGLIYASAKNITEEKKLRELNAQANTLAKIGAWEVDLEKSKIFWSKMVHQLHETDPNSFSPHLESAINFYREDYRSLVANSIEKSISTGEGFDFEAVIITQNLKEKWVRAIGHVERINGVAKRMFGSFQDITDRKESEISLQASLKSLEDYKFALDQTAIITITDTKGVIISVNDQFCKISKYSREELIGNTHSIINSKYHPKSFFAELWGTIAKGKVFRAEIKNQAKDGSYYWVDSTIVPFLDENNKPFQYVAIRIDITAKKLANEKIIEILEEKNNILESIGDAFFAVNKDWIVTYWNKQAESILGRNKEDVLGRNIWEAYPDAIDLDFYRLYHKAMSTGETINFEEYYAPLDIHVEVTVYPSDSGLSIYFKDITLRKNADAQLLKANERFEKVTQATNDAIWDWNLVENTLYWGEGFKTLFGYDVGIITPTLDSWTSNIYPNDVERVEKSLYVAMKDINVTKWIEEYRYKKSDNSFAFVVDKGVIIRDSQGVAVRMVGAMTDFTKLKEQETKLVKLNESLKNYTKELKRSNEELEQFAFITSHDLQEPLRMISSFMDQLKRKYAERLDDKANQYIHLAIDGAKRMKQIILDLLLYSRANKALDELEEVDFNEIISDFKQLRKKQIAEKSATITSIELPHLNTYRAPVSQIFHFLLDNALKYSKENVSPYIEISSIEKETEWEFAIKDNGIGIDNQFFDKIFIIFQRLHNRDLNSGTGIGLSIAKRSVEFMGGRIWLNSEVDQGSIFYFTIPKNK